MPFPYTVQTVEGKTALIIPTYNIPTMFVGAQNGNGGVRTTLFKTARRKLSMDFGGLKMPDGDISVGKRHFIKSISINAYDNNALLPLVNHVDMAAHLGGDFFTTAVLENYFALNVNGLVIHTAQLAGMTGEDMGAWIKSYQKSKYTTAHFPLLDGGYSHTSEQRDDELVAIEELGQSAPRSSIKGGLMPTDWYPNFFYMAIYRKGDDPDAVAPIWDTHSKGNIKYNTEFYETLGVVDLSGTEHLREQDVHYPVPSSTIDIDMEWDGGLLDVYVSGPGWFHGVPQQYAAGYNPKIDEITAKLSKSTGPTYATFIHCPVTIALDVMIKD
jgi:hypothetical protein